MSVPARVVLDANVLFPFTLRDTLLRSAARGLFQVYWSEQILDEAARNLAGTGRMTPQQVQRLVSALKSAFPEALVEGYEDLIASMRNDHKDRHVVAAGVKVGASVVVTCNIRDFESLPASIMAQHPDEFLCELLDFSSDEILAALHEQANALKRPPVSLTELLTGLAKSVPRFAERAWFLASHR